MKKFTAILLAVVMLFALSASAFAATNSLETDYAIGDGLGVSVDLNIEGMYFDGVDILNTATNGYYPFSFSLIVSRPRIPSPQSARRTGSRTGRRRSRAATRASR